MSNSQPSKPSSRAVVIITVATLLVFTVLFLLAFIQPPGPAASEATLSADSYLTELEPLLANADPARGEELINTKYECHACHIQGAGNVAPAFTGLGERAATRRPPLSAAAYLYESLLHPGVFLAPKDETSAYPNSMPANYGERIPAQELGDIVAFLLTQ
jgi:hypothetical protein